MSESTGCSGNCASCHSKGSCSKPQSLLEPENHLSHIKKVIGVVSGKGGVGKSMVTASLAVMMQRRGFATAILDADITGPSIPKMFGITGRASGTELGIDPRLTNNGMEVMSVNLLLEHTDDPVVWRGPVIAGTVKQFWTDVVWGEVDYMFIDMPPGTGDVPLTVFQSIPVDGIVIVTSPQDLVSMIVKKACKMAKLMNVPIVGIAYVRTAAKRSKSSARANSKRLLLKPVCQFWAVCRSIQTLLLCAMKVKSTRCRQNI